MVGSLACTSLTLSQLGIAPENVKAIDRKMTLF